MKYLYRILDVYSVRFRRGMEPTSIILQPYDGTWRMGEDYILNISIDSTVIHLMECIEKLKGISSHRQQFRLSNQKLIQKSREIWALRRHGIQNNSKIKIEPTRPGGWLWNDMEYYVEKLLNEIIEKLMKRSSPILMTELEKQIFYPPCFHYSFRVFLRQHPDQILMRTDLGSGNIWIQLANGIQLPKYEPIPLNLGYISRYDPEEFDWDLLSDVDSVKPLESQITLPDVCYEIAISGGKHFGYYGTLTDTNSFVVLLKDHKYIGHSSVKVGSRSPRWNSVRFTVGFPYGSYLGDHTLAFEVWNMKVSSINTANQQIILRKLQYVEITGSELSSFLQPEDAHVFRDYFLENKSLLEILKKEESFVSNLDMSATQVPPETEVEQKSHERPAEGDNGVDDEILDPFLKKKLFQESEKQPIDQPIDLQVQFDSVNDTDLLNCLSSTCSHGLLTVMGSKTIHQLRVLGAYELYSHETQLSEEIQPLIIILWNGIDIGQTPVQRHTRWVSYPDAIFNIPVPGNMEPGQCTLEFQVWNLEEVGGGKKLMSKVILNGRPLRELLTKNAPYAMHETLELQLPHLDDKDGDGHQGGNKKKDKGKNKNTINGGYLSIVTGLVGLHESNLRYYELQFLLGVGMARTEVQCIVYWNSIEIGKTDSAPMITEKVNKTTTQSKWIWKKNKFILRLCESDIIKQSELKIDCYDPSTKGANSYIGCAILSQEELISFLDQPYMTQQLVTLKKDPKREDKRVTKGTLTIRGGRYGSRLETERLFEIKGLEFPEWKYLKQSSEVGSPPSPQEISPPQQFDRTNQSNQLIESEKNLPHCYCVSYWNDEYLGSTNPVLHDGYPVWEILDQKWFYLSDPQSSPLFYANGILLIEIWEGNSHEIDKSSHQYIGAVQLTGNQLEDFMESNAPKTLKLQLTNFRKVATVVPTKPKKFSAVKVPPPPVVEPIAGYIILSTPGKEDPTPFSELERQETFMNNLLDDEIKHRGVEEIFEICK